MWFPYDGDSWAQNLEQEILSGEPVSNMLYFLVLTCCGPIWEEVSLLSIVVMMWRFECDLLMFGSSILSITSRLPTLMYKLLRLMFYPYGHGLLEFLHNQ